MKTVNYGIMGAGHIAADHIERMNRLGGMEVTAVASRSFDSARKAAALCGARAVESYDALLAIDEIDAIMVTSPSECHEDQVVAAIEAGKYVFCEKPLAVTAEGCQRIMQAEQAAGKRLVMVGFMRRFDRGYLLLKDAITSGEYGKPLIVHCAHRNIEAHVAYTTDMAITQTAIHEIDISRWLLDDEYVSAQVIYPPQTANATSFRDPEIIILKTAKGVVINLEIYISCHYGYDVQCEVVCENSVIRMPQPANLLIRSERAKHELLENDWVLRFDGAFDDELLAFSEGVRTGNLPGPTAWDGYAAAVTADTLIRAQSSEQIEPIVLGEKPAFYC